MSRRRGVNDRTCMLCLWADAEDVTSYGWPCETRLCRMTVMWGRLMSARPVMSRAGWGGSITRSPTARWTLPWHACQRRDGYSTLGAGPTMPSGSWLIACRQLRSWPESIRHRKWSGPHAIRLVSGSKRGREPAPQGDGTAEAEGSSPASTHCGRARVASTDCPWTSDE